MPLIRRLVSRERISSRRGSAWGSFIWGDGWWGATDQDLIADVESSNRLLSRFVLEAVPGSGTSHLWGQFVWGQTPWGIAPTTTGITRSNEPVTRVANGLVAEKFSTQIQTASLSRAAEGDIWGGFVWGQGKWGVTGPAAWQFETVQEREPVGRISTAVKGG